ncbi:MAG: CaiB/BaiF CoA transferase family protein [Dermatophilaceae bacterium]
MPASLPLQGIRVADFTQALSGPYCTMLLADLGADVVKVEIPGRGDDSRHWGPPFVGDTAAYFLAVNRNKRSIELDLRSPSGREAAAALVADSDVVVENWRPGAAARLDLDAATLTARHRRLVHCSISGFGADGPPRAGYDQIVQGMSGWMSLTGDGAGEPFKAGVPVGDISAGMFAAHGILAALLKRERTGEGSVVDVAMLDSLVAMLAYQATRFFATGVSPLREGNQHATIAPYGTFPTGDGSLNVCVGNDQQFQRLCVALDAQHLGIDPRYQTNSLRLQHRDELTVEVSEVMRRLTSADILDRLELAGVPAGPIRTLEEVFADEDVQRRGLQLRVDHEQLGQVSVPGGPWRIDDAPVSARLPPPVLGQHTAEILERLGLRSQLPTPEDPRSIPHQDDVADVAAAEREVP